MSTGRRWAQHDEDSARLPEGMRRVGYDADSRQYTFRDRKGTLYQSAPGNQYGHLTPIAGHAERAEKERPMMFEGNAPTNQSDQKTTTKPLTFQDFVPPELITSPTYGPDDKPPAVPRKKSSSSRTSQEKEKRRGHSRHTSTASASSSSSAKRHIEFTEEPTSVGETSPKERFRDAVKSSGIPRMQGVVQSLRRSVTSVTKKRFGGSKGRERPKSEIKDSKTAADYVQLSDS